MDFKSIDEIKKAEFVGFQPLTTLFSDSSIIPAIKGVYLILYAGNESPEFLSVGTGGHFKGNPNIVISDLKQNWVENSIIVYIGKAGNNTGKATLKSRLKQYFHFGQGRNIGHYGGRLIWQLKNSTDLIVCWKPLPEDNPRTVEAELIKQFVLEFGKRPFANLAD